MDDKDFDDIIKRKVGEHEDPLFDSSALSSFHQRMETLDYIPWSFRHRTELMIGSGIAIGTILIIMSVWLLNSDALKSNKKDDFLFQEQQRKIASLQAEINDLKKQKPDTVYITQVTMSDAESMQLEEMRLTILKLKNDITTSSGKIQSLSTRSDSGSLETTSNAYFGPHDSYLFSSRVVPSEKNQKSMQAIDKADGERKKSHAQFSAKTARELEKHYRKGIGIRLGPMLDLSKGFYDQGAGGIDIAGGLLGEFIVSPSLSVETGGKFIHRVYEISEEELNSNLTLPDVNSDLAPVTQADIDSWIIEVPMNLKYRYPLSSKLHALASLGYSSVIYTKQALEYSYNFDAIPSGYITEPHTITDVTRYSGTFNISLGISKRLKSNKILETSLYYQQGLGEMGVEKMNYSYIGVRGAYWFTIKK
jgi:hypothetical protein